ncbi:unnamed protein product [Sympodiomycopsis kandeliae]
MLTFLTLSLLSVSTLSNAFEVISPSVKNFWVTNHTNTLLWTYNNTDATEFSVQLLNSNQSSLIGNFQIGNSLTTANKSANIRLDAIPTGEYTLLFVNSSNYELDHPQVYYSTEKFQIMPNGTQPATISDSNGDTTTATTSGTPDATISADSNNNNDNSNTDDTNAAKSNAFVVLSATGSLLLASVVLATVSTL